MVSTMFEVGCSIAFEEDAVWLGGLGIIFTQFSAMSKSFPYVLDENLAAFSAIFVGLV